MANQETQVQTVVSATIRFAGDSGDGMQLAGMRFTDACALLGNDVVTMPDYPAEIRAPAGTVAGVSGFQVNFASRDIKTPGDELDVLIAMNPAALKANLPDVRSGGLVIVNEDEFDAGGLKRAGYAEGYDPLEDLSLTARFKFFKIPMTRLTKEALVDSTLGAKEGLKTRNMYALGLILWLYDRPLSTAENFLNDYFRTRKNRPDIAEANLAVLRAGFHFGETARLFTHRYHVDAAVLAPGTYRRVTGNEALALGLTAAAGLAGKQLIYCSYPITPASDILHQLAALKRFGVKTIQSEDEISAVCAAIGASFAGQLGATGTSGPGLALKTEALGLAVMTELPLVVIDIQRAGPSTGMPTKTEQSDLLQALCGRNGEAPLVVLAPRSPADCFDTGLEAARLAMLHMTPVLVLSDGYLGNGAEPWRLPDPGDLAPIAIAHPAAPPAPADGETTPPFLPYARDEDLVRPWAIPGTPGLEHRIGGLEKQDRTGNVSYDGLNHQRMVQLRREKIERIARRLPPLEVEGAPDADLVIVGWGGTYGTIAAAVERLRETPAPVAHVHLRHLSPLPADLGGILARHDRILVPELNAGQLRRILRDRYLVDARGFNKVQGQVFHVDEILEAVAALRAGDYGDDVSRMPGTTAGREV